VVSVRSQILAQLEPLTAPPCLITATLLNALTFMMKVAMFLIRLAALMWKFLLIVNSAPKRNLLRHIPVPLAALFLAQLA
jgi:hypothetical protein